MTLLIVVGITEICSFRLVLKGKASKEISVPSRLQCLEKFLASNFALWDAEDNTFGPLNRGGISDLPLLKTLWAICQKSQQPSCLISIWTFGSFKNPFTTITNLPELYFRFWRFTLLEQTKKVISMNCGSSPSSWKTWWWVSIYVVVRYIHNFQSDPTHEIH